MKVIVIVMKYYLLRKIVTKVCERFTKVIIIVTKYYLLRKNYLLRELIIVKDYLLYREFYGNSRRKLSEREREGKKGRLFITFEKLK